jgi:hypothetical protein
MKIAKAYTLRIVNRLTWTRAGQAL